MAKVEFPFDINQIEENKVEAPVDTETKPVVETKPETPIDTPEVPVVEISQEDADAEEVKLLETLKKRGFKGESIDDFLKPKAPAKTYDEATQKFIDYQSRTGRGLNDWEQYNKDVSKMDPVEVAKDRLKKESEGVDLTDQDLNYLLEEELGFNPEDEYLDEKEKAKFKKYWGSHLNTLKNEQQKFNEPLKNFKSENIDASQSDDGKKIMLSNGHEVDQVSYEQDRQKYLADRDAALQSLGEETFLLSYDGKDGKKELPFNYKYTDEDLHSMKSISEDVGGILSNYQNEDGFNHKTFNQDILWTKPEFRNKAISALLSKARNQVITEMTSQRKNLNFDSPNETPKSAKSGYTEPGSQKSTSGPQVQFALPSN